MKLSLAIAMAMVLTTASILSHELKLAHGANARVPVLVELFTSEGCSSCPPADTLLEKLDRQPIPDVEIIVLSEHVDYWNHIGWKDPYSSHSYSQRQSNYAKRFGLGNVYTPQMVVDGAVEFVGSNSSLAYKSLARAGSLPKIAVRISSALLEPNMTLRIRVEAGALTAPFKQREAEVYVAVALNRADSRVSGGENGGRTLSHVAVVRNFVKIATFKHDEGFTREVQLTLEPVLDAHNLRVIAFVQEPDQGRILGAAERLVVR